MCEPSVAGDPYRLRLKRREPDVRVRSGRRQDDCRDRLQVLIALDPGQDLATVHLGKVQVEQDEIYAASRSQVMHVSGVPRIYENPVLPRRGGSRARALPEHIPRHAACAGAIVGPPPV